MLVEDSNEEGVLSEEVEENFLVASQVVAVENWREVVIEYLVEGME